MRVTWVGLSAAIALSACADFEPSARLVEAGVFHVDTAPGVTLEVVDWGGEGTPLVLLAGGGGTAHAFDDFAPELTDSFRVFGITRRGVGASAGASPDELSDHVSDIAAVVRALELESVVLVGHSMAGMELPRFGEEYAGLCQGLVYLDAAYDYTDPELGRVLTEAPPPPPPPMSSADSASVQAYRAWSERIQGYSMPEAEIRARRLLDDSGRLIGVKPNTSMRVAPEPPEWSSVACPSLGLYPVVAALETWLPYYADRYESLSADERSIAERYVQEYGAWTAAQREAFGRFPQNEVVEFVGRGHFFFLTKPGEVVPVIENWVANLGG